MPLFEASMRVRIKDRHQDTPMGLWGKEGEVVGVNTPPPPGGEFNFAHEQVYSVLLDGESAPMKTFEAWLELAIPHMRLRS